MWSEGTFSVLKREHNLRRATKRGIYRIGEECLLSTLALNLKRIVKALGSMDGPFDYTIIYAKILVFLRKKLFVNRSNFPRSRSFAYKEHTPSFYLIQ
ncbi:hypothetical protein LMF89_14180 [Pelosinus sp. Bkl1]|uniref:Transposase DDE domain-containing protein n=1 Tax=Pelosinus baikalensis TaxID=2892015 RepID=A0ABS8HTT9_9FIRM|nr:hypothetical protein [Pelosinus baikalensis]